MVAPRSARPAPPQAGPAAPRPALGGLVGEVGSWFGAWGMQTVLFSWLVVGELRADPEWVGVAQMAVLAPALALMLVGGAAADRFDPRRVLAATHALAALPILALGAAVASGALALPGLLAYAVSMGAVAAFVNPAREAILVRVAGGDLMRTVTVATAAQFGAQAAGALVAGSARWLGSAPALGVQAAVVLAGLLFVRGLPGRAADAAPPLPFRPGEVTDGLRHVLRRPELRVLVALVMAVGLFFAGPFLVIFPLLVRDVYAGEVAQLSLTLLLFPVGTITGSLVLLARGGVRRKGRALLLALAAGAATLGTIATGLPFPAFLAATFLWGLFGSVFMNTSRTLYQELAPTERRARVLSVYPLGFMGSAPLGALLAGFVSARLGPLGAVAVGAGGMLLAVATAALATRVPRME